MEALLSPPHLALAACGILAFSGPIRSVWSRPTTSPSWRRHGPAVVGLAAMLSLFAAFTQYAHPIIDPWAQATVEETARPPRSQLYAMAADGTGQHRIAVTDADERNPRLSPDGRRLAFDTFVDGSEQIVVSDPDGSNRTTIAIDGNNARPAWSPDGSRIAFHSDRAGSLDVYTMAADGSDVRHVTAEPSADWGATWSPDGTRIAFTSDRAGASDIYSARADGTDLVRLTEGIGGDGDPAWSPDGTRIAFGSEGADGDVDVVSMAADGTDPRRLTDAVGSSYLPAWSPDGQSIAFATDRDGDLEVYVMNADGTNQRNLTRSPGVTDGWFGPSWSPDGSAILYPSQGEVASSQVQEMTQSLGAASILIQTALLAGFALVALRHGPLPFGALTVLVFAPTVLMALVSDEYRFLPGALLAGVTADLLVWRLGFGSARRTDAVIAFAIPAAFFTAFFVTLQLTGGIGWTIHLWLGAIVLAGVIGLVLDEAMRDGQVTRISATHLTQSRPRRSGTTSRHGAPFPVGSSPPATPVARREPRASAIGRSVDQPVTEVTRTLPCPASGSTPEARSKAAIGTPRQPVSSTQPDVQSSTAARSVSPSARSSTIDQTAAPVSAVETVTRHARESMVGRALTEEGRHRWDTARRQPARSGEAPIAASPAIDQHGDREQAEASGHQAAGRKERSTRHATGRVCPRGRPATQGAQQPPASWKQVDDDERHERQPDPRVQGQHGPCAERQELAARHPEESATERRDGQEADEQPQCQPTDVACPDRLRDRPAELDRGRDDQRASEDPVKREHPGSVRRPASQREETRRRHRDDEDGEHPVERRVGHVGLSSELSSPDDRQVRRSWTAGVRASASVWAGGHDLAMRH